MKITIPNSGVIELKTVILDLNGTITIQGSLIKGVASKINSLKKNGYKVMLFSGDTRGTAQGLCNKLGIDLIIAKNGKEKAAAAKKLDPKTCIAIGNGLIDAPLFKTVRLAIAVLQAEGLHVKALHHTDVVMPSIIDALNLLLDEPTLIATLRV